MNYINKKPIVFFVNVLIIFLLTLSFLSIFLSLNYFSINSESLVNQENNFLLAEGANNLSADWNKIFFLMGQSLEVENYNLTTTSEKFYLDQSRYDSKAFKDYYSSFAKRSEQSSVLVQFFLNINRDVNLLESYLSDFYNYLRGGNKEAAYNLFRRDISQLQISLNNNTNSFSTEVRQQNFNFNNRITQKQQANIIWIIIIFLINLSLSIIILFLARWSLSRYFKNLNQAIYRVASGDLEQRLPENKGPRDICDLSHAFNGMVLKFKDSSNSLLARIKEKSLELDRILIESQGQLIDLEEQRENLKKTKTSVLNILEDVNDEKSRADLLSQDLQKFKLAVDHASDYIIITDKNGIIVYANQGVEDITGFTPAEVLGKKVGVKSLWGGNMPLDFYQKLWETVKVNKQSFTSDFNNRRKNGEDFVADISISPILDRNKDVEFFVSIGRDITVAKQIDLAKTEFVSLASHQLRTPLTSIKWNAEMLLSGDAGELKGDQTDFTKEIFNSNERMIELVDSLLNVSRLDLGTLKVEGVPTDILELVKDLVREVEPLIVRKQVKLTEKYDPKLPIIELDKKLFFMVVQNLLTNAVKYSKTGGKVNIEIGFDGPNNVLIQVSDNGYGISVKDQDRITTKFFRADNARKIEPDGNGLGLYIVKSIVDKARGRLWFESKEGKGTTFYVSLPIKLPKK
ncbi:MAG: ATP-binding protein [Patescibacteria group bacterium]